MKSVSLFLVLAFSGVFVCEDRLIMGLGQRQLDDQLLERITSKSETFKTPQLVRVDIDFDLGSRYYTYVLFQTPNDNHRNASVQDVLARNRIRASFFATESLSHEVTAVIYGYLYSPGPVYP